MRRVKEKLEGFYGMEVDSVGRSGGLAFLWRKGVDCTFLSASVHHMDFLIPSERGEWRVTGFYGWPAVTDRHLSWELLRILSRQSAVPWVCMGDFNEVLFSTKMKGGSRPQWKMNNFRAAVDDCELRDVPWEGYNFSYDNGQAGDSNRQSMIDRALCTAPWRELFPYARHYYLEREWSDHAPIKLVLNAREEGSPKRRQFRFEQIWVGDEEYLTRQEEQYWRQRSRALWLKDGDRNTKFFHTRAGERRQKNHIAKLVDDEGINREGDDVVSKVANDYFQQLFATSNPTVDDDVMQGLGRRVTDGIK
ncbi:uncharacterized protein LOC141608694 [Silene latifolia]|uniref:uncharacterized protein LOC141608694 n=1 Tax=Silene latifolia TaxID=37657 RepID=UPI003D786250